MTRYVQIPFEDAQRIFDLAVDSPLVCSGSFETDDVRVLRAFAETIGADPQAATPPEFVKDFPHPFVPFNIDLERNEVGTGVYRDGYMGACVEVTRFETDEEVYARLGANTDRCGAGTYNRRCRRTKADPIHT